ncbi:MAG: hypothetical protein ACI9U2_002484 [Bradymonadia bacterium]|jgi:hypothetical protein
MKIPHVVTLAASAKPTQWLCMPELAEVFGDPDSIPDNLLRPLLKVDGGAIRAELEGIPICVVAHEVGIDNLSFHVEADGRYTLREYGPVEMPTPADVRPSLDAYIDEDCGGPDGLEDENEELFDEHEDRTYLRVDDDGDVTLELGCSTWLQGREASPDDTDEFAFALCGHPVLFGRYYVFVNPIERTVRQVFQCT